MCIFITQIFKSIKTVPIASPRVLNLDVSNRIQSEVSGLGQGLDISSLCVFISLSISRLRPISCHYYLHK